MHDRSKMEKAKWRLTGSRVEPKDRAKAVAVALAMLAAGFGAWLMPSLEANASAPDVVIRQVMTANPQVCHSVNGEYYDWIELENTGDEAVDLKGWRLTDTGDLRDAYSFDSHTLSPGERLIVYCDKVPEGYAGDAPFTGFKLSSDGELLLLSDTMQRTAGVSVPPLRKGFVYMRDAATGEYESRPYGEMSDAEKAERAQADGFNSQNVMISEVMPVNRSILADGDGEFSDWIELYNPRSEAVNLEGWALTDDDIKLAKWVFPARTLQPGEYMVVFASGKNKTGANGEIHTNFRLSAKGETIRLSNPDGEVVSQVTYKHTSADQSLCRESDGSMTDELAPSPGGANLAPGQQGEYGILEVNAAGLYINEIYYGGENVDWVELYNAGNQGLDLSGAGLSDNPAKPRKWQFPEGATIQAGGYVVVALPGSPERQAERLANATPAPEASPAPITLRPDYTADFGLVSGETICLSTKNGRIVDRVMLSGKYDNASIGRASGFAGLRYFGVMTPGEANAPTSYASVGREVTLSPAPGVIHESSVEVTMTADPGVNIYYTTDGSEPTASSNLYSGPITLTENTMLRYVADPAEVLDPVYGVDSYIFGPHTLRLLTVTGRDKDLTRSDASLNTGDKGAGCNVYAEIYEPDGQKLAGQTVYFCLTGHNSRTHNSQRSFKLVAKRELGDTRFRARLFSNRDYDAVKKLLIRASGQDYKQTHMLDSVLTSLAHDTHVFYQESECCVLYVNKQYWGLYNMREHVDTHSLCQFEGWTDPDQVTIIQGDGDGARATAGSVKAYKAFWAWLKGADLTKASDMEAMRSAFDIESYLDYVAFEMYTNNSDLGNIRCYRSETEDPRWKYILFDLDLSYRNKTSDPLNNVKGWFNNTVGSTTSQDTLPFRKLMQNAEAREYFLTRMGELLADNMASENVVAKIEARRDLIKDEMLLNCKRWKWKYADWEKAVQRIINYAESRPGKLIGYFQETFKLSDADTQRYFGGAMEKVQARQAMQVETSDTNG